MSGLSNEIAPRGGGVGDAAEANAGEGLLDYLMNQNISGVGPAGDGSSVLAETAAAGAPQEIGLAAAGAVDTAGGAWRWNDSWYPIALDKFQLFEEMDAGGEKNRQREVFHEEMSQRAAEAQRQHDVCCAVENEAEQAANAAWEQAATQLDIKWMKAKDAAGKANIAVTVAELNVRRVGELLNASRAPEDDAEAAGGGGGGASAEETAEAAAATAEQLREAQKALSATQEALSQAKAQLAAVQQEARVTAAAGAAASVTAVTTAAGAAASVTAGTPRTPPRAAGGVPPQLGWNPLTGGRVSRVLTPEQVLLLPLVEAAAVVARWSQKEEPGVRHLILAARQVATLMRVDSELLTLDGLLRMLSTVASTGSAEKPGFTPQAAQAATEMRKLQLQLKHNMTAAAASAAAEKWLNEMIQHIIAHSLYGTNAVVVEAPPLTVGVASAAHRLKEFLHIYGCLEQHAWKLMEMVFQPLQQLTEETVYPYTQVSVVMKVGDTFKVDQGARTMALLVAVACLLEKVRAVEPPRSYREKLAYYCADAGAPFPWKLGPSLVQTLRDAEKAAYTMVVNCVVPPAGVAAWRLITDLAQPLLPAHVARNLVERIIEHARVREGVPVQGQAPVRLWEVWVKLKVDEETEGAESAMAGEGRSETETMARQLEKLSFGEIVTLLQWAATAIDKADLASAAYRLNFMAAPDPKLVPVAAAIAAAKAAEAQKVLALGAGRPPFGAMRPPRGVPPGAPLGALPGARPLPFAPRGAPRAPFTPRPLGGGMNAKEWALRQKCYNCGVIGHLANTCTMGKGAPGPKGAALPRPPGPGGGGGGGAAQPTCWKCKEAGHRSSECPQKQPGTMRALFGSEPPRSEPPAGEHAPVNPLLAALNSMLNGIEDANTDSGLRTGLKVLVSSTASVELGESVALPAGALVALPAGALAALPAGALVAPPAGALVALPAGAPVDARSEAMVERKARWDTVMVDIKARVEFLVVEKEARDERIAAEEKLRTARSAAPYGFDEEVFGTWGYYVKVRVEWEKRERERKREDRWRGHFSTRWSDERMRGPRQEDRQGAHWGRQAAHAARRKEKRRDKLLFEKHQRACHREGQQLAAREEQLREARRKEEQEVRAMRVKSWEIIGKLRAADTKAARKRDAMRHAAAKAAKNLTAARIATAEVASTAAAERPPVELPAAQLGALVALPAAELSALVQPLVEQHVAEQLPVASAVALPRSRLSALAAEFVPAVQPMVVAPLRLGVARSDIKTVKIGDEGYWMWGKRAVRGFINQRPEDARITAHTLRFVGLGEPGCPRRGADVPCCADAACYSVVARTAMLSRSLSGVETMRMLSARGAPAGAVAVTQRGVDYGEIAAQKALRGQDAWNCEDGDWIEGVNVVTVQPGGACILVCEGPSVAGKARQLRALFDTGACNYLNGAGALASAEWATGLNVEVFEGPEVTVSSATGPWLKSKTYARFPLTFHISGEVTEEERAGGIEAAIRTTGGMITVVLAEAAQWRKGNLGDDIGMVVCPALFAPRSNTPEEDKAWMRELQRRASEASWGGARFRTHVVVTGGHEGETRGGTFDETRVTAFKAFGDVPLANAPPLGMFNDVDEDELPAKSGVGRLPYNQRPGIARGEALLKKLNWSHLEGDAPHERAHREQVDRLNLRKRLEEVILEREVLFGNAQPGGPPIHFRVKEGAAPVRSGLRQRDPPQYVDSIYDQVQTLAGKGMVRKVADDISVAGAVPADHHVHPKVLAEKKVPAGAPAGTRPGVRMCLNAKELNQLIPEEDMFKTVLPKATEIRGAMLGAMLETGLDQADAFNSRRLHPECYKLFCFTAKNPETGKIELWQYLCMIFGHMHAPGLFHESQETMIADVRLMDALTALCLYLDDLGIGTKPQKGAMEEVTEAKVATDASELGAAPVTDEVMLEMFERHLKVLCAVMDKMIEAEISLNLSKCAFLQRKWAMLGLIMDGRYYAVDPSRTQGFRALAKVPAKLSLSWLRKTMGVLVAYKHTAGTAWGRLIEPLAELLTKATNEGRLAAAAKDVGRRQTAARMVEREWEPKRHGEALKAIVALLVANGIMALPDPSLAYYIDGDACDTGYGCKLAQMHSGVEVVIDTFSIKFSLSQQKWSVAVRELYTQLQAARRWWRWLQGCKVVWRNDHHNLLEVKDLRNAFIGRWVAELSLLAEWASGTRVFAGGAIMSVVDKFSRDEIGCDAAHDYADGLLVPVTATLALKQLQEEKQTSSHLLRMMTLYEASHEMHTEVRSCVERVTELDAEMDRVMIGRHLFGEEMAVQGMLALTNGGELTTTEPPLPKFTKVHESMYSPLLVQVLAAQRALSKEQREALDKELSPHVRAHKLDEGEVLLYRGRVLVPREAADLRNKLMKLFHDPLHDHVEASLKRMHDAALHLVGGKEFAMEYYRSCLPCQLARAPTAARQVVPMLMPARPERPLAELTMDFVTIVQCPTVAGSTKKGEQGEKGLLIIMDLATGYSMPIVVSAYTAKAACNGLEQWAGVFGYPMLVRVDGGSHFLGEFVKTCEAHDVVIDRGTAHHHEGRGAVEASAKRYAEALRRLLPEGQQTAWPSLFPRLARLVNSVPGKTRMGRTPFELLFPGVWDPAEKLWGALKEESLECMTNAMVAQREMAGVALDFWTVVSKVRHDARLTPFNEVTGAFLPVLGEWVLLQNVLKAGKMDPDYNGPYVVVAVETNTKEIPTGWVTVAEVLGGISPGQVGYPARGKSVVVVADRLWPFDPSRVTANDVMLWKLPEGWKVVMDVLSGPRKRDGRFQVLWSHQTEPTWVFPTEIWTAVAFRKYCEVKKINLKKLAADARVKMALPVLPEPKAAPVLAPPAVVAPKAPPAEVKRGAPRETRARGGQPDTSAASVWYCSVCGQVVLPTETGYVKKSHGKCRGSGKPATQG